MQLRVLFEAELEGTEAALRYEDERAGLGGEFLAELDAAMESIAAHPLHHPRYEAIADEHSFRRVVLKRFPYVVVFSIVGDEILIVAVAHASRRPGYWQHRVPQ